MKDKLTLWLVIISFSGGLAAVLTDLLINFDSTLKGNPPVVFIILWIFIAFIFWLIEGFIDAKQKT